MTIKGIPISDLIYLATIVLGVLVPWLARQPRLPKEAQKYLKALSTDKLLGIVEAVAADISATPEERRAKALELLQRAAEKKLGTRLPDSIANLLLEYAYQLYKLALAKVKK